MKPIKSGLFCFLFHWIISITIIIPFQSVLYNETRLVQVLILSLCATIVVRLLFWHRIGTVITAAAAILGAGRILWLLLSEGVPHEAFLKTAYAFGTVFEKLYFYEMILGTEWEPLLLPISIMLACAVALVVYWLTIRRTHFFLLLGLGLAAYGTGIGMAGLENKEAFLVFVALTIISYARFVAEKRGVSGLVADAGQMPDNRFVHVLPIAMLVVLIIFLVPKPVYPLQWQWLDTKITNTYTWFEERFTKTDAEYFNLGAAGFSGRSDRLGGRIRPGNTLVMTVKADNRAYLRGAAFGSYTGDAWLRLLPEDQYSILASEGERKFDINEMRNAWLMMPVDDLYPQASDEMLDMLHSLHSGELEILLFPQYGMSVRYRNLSTKSVMLPLKTLLPVEATSGSPLQLRENAHGAAAINEKLPFGTRYSFQFIQPMYGDPIMQQALQLSYKGLYADALAIAVNTEMADESVTVDSNTSADDAAASIINEEDVIQITPYSTDMQTLTIRELVAHAQLMHDRYTQVPETLPDRVRQLALDLTDPFETQYEKVVAIRNYLRDTYPYTMDTRRLPEDTDFVDWFLFEEREGYCTYYATAMAIMLRTLDIPTRYVEGYALPDKDEDAEEYRVTNKQAHAWTEVYFEGFGWLTFEPTAGMGGVTDFIIPHEVAQAQLASGYSEDMYDMMARFMGDMDIPDLSGLPIDGTGVAEHKTGPVPYLLSVLGLIILMWGGSTLYGRIRRRLVRSRSGIREVELLMYRMIKQLGVVGYQMESGETILEYAVRIDRLYLLDNMNMTAAAHLFMACHYGKKEPEKSDLLRITILAYDLRRLILQDLGWRRYLPLREIFLGL